MIRRLLRSGPKYLIAALIVVVSVGGFCLWLYLRHFHQTNSVTAPVAKPSEDIGPKLAKIEANWGRLILVDNNLYDLDDGALLFTGWLSGGMPGKIFYEPETKSVLALYETALMRYGLDGKQRNALVRKSRLVLSEGYKYLLYVKDKDLWRADLDFKELKPTNEKKLTSIEQLSDSFFAESVILATDKTLVLRNAGRILRVSLASGDVHPTRIPMPEIGKRRSPDSKSLVGVDNGQFYCYDVDSDQATTAPVGRERFLDFQWLDNDHCVAVTDAHRILSYDRVNHALALVASIPFPANQISHPSTDGHYAFCSGGGKAGALLDLKAKTVTMVAGGEGVTWTSSESFIFSRELPDSDLRGSWIQKAGQAERRIWPEPFLVTRVGGAILPVKGAGKVVFATKQRLVKMGPDGEEVTELFSYQRVPGSMLELEEFKSQ